MTHPFHSWELQSSERLLGAGWLLRVGVKEVWLQSGLECAGRLKPGAKPRKAASCLWTVLSSCVKVHPWNNILASRRGTRSAGWWLSRKLNYLRNNLGFQIRNLKGRRDTFKLEGINNPHTWMLWSMDHFPSFEAGIELCLRLHFWALSVYRGSAPCSLRDLGHPVGAMSILAVLLGVLPDADRPRRPAVDHFHVDLDAESKAQTRKCVLTPHHPLCPPLSLSHSSFSLCYLNAICARSLFKCYFLYKLCFQGELNLCVFQVLWHSVGVPITLTWA